MNIGDKVIITESDWFHDKGEIAKIVSIEKSDNMPYKLRFKNGDELWFRKDQVKPYRGKNGYTSSLREKCRNYFSGATSRDINNFIKAVERLNAKHGF